MDFVFKNGRILDSSVANFNLASTEFSYGFGVYETLKVRSGKLFFVKRHAQRLLFSAQNIFLKHSLNQEQIQNWLISFAKFLKTKTESDDFSTNLKVFLVGNKNNLQADFLIVPLNPLFVDKKLRKKGVSTIAFEYQRWQPESKSLNMLPSYVYFSLAKKLNCYDALFMNFNQEILEGSRTNFYLLQDKTIFTPPKDEVLNGITRQTILETAIQSDFKIVEKKVKLSDFQQFDASFLSSTSTKILPTQTIFKNSFKDLNQLQNLQKLEQIQFKKLPENLKFLIKKYDEYLNESKEVVLV